MRSKKGFIGVSWILGIVFFVIATISIILLIFNQNIKDAVTILADIFNQTKYWILGLIVFFILWRLGLIKKLFDLLKSLLKILKLA